MTRAQCNCCGEWVETPHGVRRVWHFIVCHACYKPESAFLQEMPRCVTHEFGEFKQPPRYDREEVV